MSHRPGSSFAGLLPYLTIVLGFILLFGGLAIVTVFPIAGAYGFVLGPILVPVGFIWAVLQDWKKKPASILNKVKALWAMQYSIGHPTIDAQHQELFHRIESVMDSVGDSGQAAQFQKTYKFLMEYVEEHFNDEETLMAELNYPGRDAHIQLHQGFRKRVEQFADERQNFKDPKDQQAFVDLISDWLVKHILVEDKKIGEFSKANPAKA